MEFRIVQSNIFTPLPGAAGIPLKNIHRAGVGPFFVFFRRPYNDRIAVYRRRGSKPHTVGTIGRNQLGRFHPLTVPSLEDKGGTRARASVVIPGCANHNSVPADSCGGPEAVKRGTVAGPPALRSKT